MPLLQTGLLKEYLKAAACLRSISGGKCCIWDSVAKRLQFIRRPCVFGAILSGIFGLPEIVHTAKSLVNRKNGHGNVDSVECQLLNLGILSTQGNICGFLFAMYFVRYCKQMEWLWNQLLLTEQKYLKYDADLAANKNAKVAKACCKLFTLGVHMVSLGCATLSTAAAQNPFNLFSFPPGSLILSSIQQRKHPGIGKLVFVKVITFCGNYLVWSMTVKRTFLITIELLIGCVSLTLLLLMFKRNQSRISFTSNKTTAVPKLWHATLFYRQIQILAHAFNQIASGQLVLFLVTFGVAQICCSLELMNGTGREKLSFAEYANMGFCIVCLPPVCVGINFIFGFCAQVHDTSCRILEDMRCRITGLEPVIYNKLRKSYQVVRVNFGATNYIDKLTPCVFQMFLVLRLVDLLLIK